MYLHLRIKELRCEYGKTQAQLAQDLNVKQNTYSQYENGHRQIPLDLLIRLAEYYDVTIDYLLNLSDY
ncbi:MAG: helix-turn-helix domain-containing protein [Clostridia bacterium]|nr:helix-turn-helix domain-containing protein [Clostridia bacterium]